MENISSACWLIKFIFDDEIPENLSDFFDDYFDVVAINYNDDEGQEAVGYKSLDFDEIKNKTEEIFVQSYEKSKKAPNPKAVVQITNYIKKLLDGDYDNNDLSFRYNQSYYIYPIILFTDYKYNSSGIGYYIRERFFDITKGKKGRINHLVKNGRIKPVTFIGLDFFFNNIYSFSQNKRLLKKLIDEYHLEINKEETLNLKAPAPFDRDLYPSFERYHSKYNYIIPPIANKEIEFFKIFGIIFT